jgi:prepilin peptidase CpaA
MTQIQATVFCVMLALCAWSDVKARRIPNWLTLGGIAVALILRATSGGAALAAGAQGAAVGIGLGMLLFGLKLFGAGDGKLLGAVGAFLGLGSLWVALLATGVAGGLLALRDARVRGTTLQVLASVQSTVVFWVTGGRRGERPSWGNATFDSVPYGVAICVGALVGWLY